MLLGALLRGKMLKTAKYEQSEGFAQYADPQIYDQVYQDDFDWSDMSHSKWKPGFRYASEQLKSVHSYTQAAIAMNHGKNTTTQNSVLTIATCKEKVTAPAWDAQKGMVMREFDYTSDVIHQAALEIQEGVIQVKAHVSGKQHHSIYLAGENQMPVISIMDCCCKRLFCNVKEDAQDTHAKVDLGRWCPNQELIFTLVITPVELVWYINNMQVHSMANRLSKNQKYYLHMGSFGGKKQKGAGELNVSWLRVYHKK